MDSGILSQQWAEFEKSLSKRLELSGKKETAIFFVKKKFVERLWVLGAVWILYAVFFLDLVAGFGVGAIVFLGWFFAGINAPFSDLTRKTEQFEKELPLALMALSVELNIGIPFERGLADIARSGYGRTSAEFKTVFDEVAKKGSSVSESLQHLSDRLESRQVRRVVLALINAYEQGSRKEAGLAVRRIGLELLSEQRIKAREFGSKLAVFSLVFITVSAIAPALFQSFVIVGGLFLDFDFSPLQVLLAITVGFPALDLGVLGLIRNQTPVFLRDWK